MLVSERLGRATWDDAPADTCILAVVFIFVCLQPRSLRACCSVMHSPPPPFLLSSPVKLCRPMLAPSACKRAIHEDFIGDMHCVES